MLVVFEIVLSLSFNLLLYFNAFWSLEVPSEQHSYNLIHYQLTRSSHKNLTLITAFSMFVELSLARDLFLEYKKTGFYMNNRRYTTSKLLDSFITACSHFLKTESTTSTEQQCKRKGKKKKGKKDVTVPRNHVQSRFSQSVSRGSCHYLVLLSRFSDVCQIPLWGSLPTLL